MLLQNDSQLSRNKLSSEGQMRDARDHYQRTSVCFCLLNSNCIIYCSFAS